MHACEAIITTEPQIQGAFAVVIPTTQHFPKLTS